MKLVVYLRCVDENQNPTLDCEIRDEILWFEDDDVGCHLSSNSTRMICSERFNRYWVECNRNDVDEDEKMKHIKDNIISKNFHRRMKFNLDEE